MIYADCAGCGVGSDERHHICTHHCGYLASTNYPFPYADDIALTWTIEVDFGNYIQLDFIQIEVESSNPECLSDYVLVQDVDSNGNLRVGLKHCLHIS